MLALTVVHDFGSYKRGDQITDAEDMAKVRDSENHANVVLTNVPDAPGAQAKDTAK